MEKKRKPTTNKGKNPWLWSSVTKNWDVPPLERFYILLLSLMPMPLIQVHSSLQPQGFLRGWASRGTVLIWRPLRPFIPPTPSQGEQPSCLYNHADRCIWLACSSLPTSSTQGQSSQDCTCPWHWTHRPASQMSCHISSWHQSTLENRKH